jgi:hypothetical protein
VVIRKCAPLPALLLALAGAAIAPATAMLIEAAQSRPQRIQPPTRRPLRRKARGGGQGGPLHDTEFLSTLPTTPIPAT